MVLVGVYQLVSHTMITATDYKLSKITSMYFQTCCHQILHLRQRISNMQQCQPHDILLHAYCYPDVIYFQQHVDTSSRFMVGLCFAVL